MSKNRHTGTGRFVAGKSTGTYRGQMRHDPSTEAIKTRLHTAPSRKVVATHAGVQSVATDAGAKPHAHDCEGDCNVAANAKVNAAMSASGSPRLTTDPAQIVGSGIKLS
jgi:hypothetical protein